MSRCVSDLRPSASLEHPAVFESRLVRFRTDDKAGGAQFANMGQSRPTGGADTAEISFQRRAPRVPLTKSPGLYRAEFPNRKIIVNSKCYCVLFKDFKGGWDFVLYTVCLSDLQN